MSPREHASARRRTATALAALLAVAGGPVGAKPRSADDVLADFVTALGGAKAYRHRTLYVKTRITVRSANRGEPPYYGVEEFWFGPDSWRFLARGPTFWWEEACTRTDCWFFDRMGLRIEPPAAAARQRAKSTPITEHRLRTIFKVRRLVPAPAGAPTGKPLECVSLSAGPADARQIDCFDVHTRLRVYQETTEENGVESRAVSTAYQKLNGMVFSSRDEVRKGNELRIYEVIDAATDVTLEPALFRAPAITSRRKLTR